MPGPIFPTPVWPSAESLPLSSLLRQIYPEDTYPEGSYFPSPYGRVRYAILGPEDGSKVVLIHGITTPSSKFKDAANILTSRGLRVLVYDLYGRGYSEAPKGIPQEPNLFAVQLSLLLQYIQWDNTNIVGMSMGGGIAATFASLFPHLVKSIVLLSSTGLMELPTDQDGELTLPLPKIGSAPESTVSAYDLRNLQAAELPGYMESLISSIRYGPLTNMRWAFERLGESEKRVLIIHGTADEVVPHTEAAKIKRLVPQAETVDIEGGTHFLLIQDGVWQDVAERIARYFTSQNRD